MRRVNEFEGVGPFDHQSDKRLTNYPSKLSLIRTICFFVCAPAQNDRMLKPPTPRSYSWPLSTRTAAATTASQQQQRLMCVCRASVVYIHVLPSTVNNSMLFMLNFVLESNVTPISSRRPPRESRLNLSYNMCTTIAGFPNKAV